MEEDDFNFDFESTLEEQQKVAAKAQASSAAAGTSAGPVNQSAGSFRRNYRQTVCTYWLKGVCALGDNCGFLHEYNTERMPVCKTLIRFGICKEPDCPFKHNLEDIKECNMFKLGFCIYGPQCRYRHTRLPGPPPEPKDVDAAKPKPFRSTGRTAEKPEYSSSRGRGRFHPYSRPRPEGSGSRPPPPQLEGPPSDGREALPPPHRHQRPRPPPMPPQMGYGPMGMPGMMPPGMMPGMHMGMPGMRMPMPPFWRGPPMGGPFPPYGYR